MTKAELAKQTNKSVAYIEFILSGKRRPSPKLAAELEKVTGIPRLCWLYPGEYYNPMIRQKEVKEGERDVVVSEGQ